MRVQSYCFLLEKHSFTAFFFCFLTLFISHFTSPPCICTHFLRNFAADLLIMKRVIFKKAIASLRQACTFCARHTGLNAVYLGVILFAVIYLTGATDHNALLYLPFLLIVVGTIGFVRQRKSEEKY